MSCSLALKVIAHLVAREDIGQKQSLRNLSVLLFFYWGTVCVRGGGVEVGGSIRISVLEFSCLPFYVIRQTRLVFSLVLTTVN